MDHDFAGGENLRLKRDSKRCLSPPRLEFPRDRVGLVRVTAGASLDLFLSLLRLFFRIHRFRAALQAQGTAERQDRTNLGRVLTHRIRYKNRLARREPSERRAQNNSETIIKFES